MRRKPQRRRAMIALDAVLCTAVTVGIASAAYVIVRVALGAHLAFIESAVGMSLM